MNQTPTTLGDELLRLAVRRGVATSTSAGPTLPTGTTYDQLKNSYMDAAEEFARKRTWSWACPTVTLALSTDGTGDLCVGGSASVYALPFVASGQPMSVRCGENSEVDVADAGYLRREIALDDGYTGPPQAIGVEDVALAGTSPTKQSVVVVWPKPDNAYSLSFRIKKANPLPRDLADELPWGFEHNTAVFRMAEYRAARAGCGGADSDIELIKADADAALAESVALDAQAWGSTAIPMRSPVFGITRPRTKTVRWASTQGA